MSDMEDLVRNPNNAEDFLKFISYNGYQYLYEMTAQLSLFVENSFLKNLFDKGSQAMDKVQLLVVGCFATRAYTLYGDMNDNTELEYPSADDELFASTSSSNTKTTPKPVLETPPILPDVGRLKSCLIM
ncbi:hypothetical protein RhiirA4_471325 [Rhizophagus irregularis]|uniref:Uncharacterized protein n=1 Tax=Rhizophagus irregularis TaxID=588596 RepID=A0A2I1H2W9_9GLOM|nr:hypothetical protein RhiirA4_471325 [Rhizophagus irregularis]